MLWNDTDTLGRFSSIFNKGNNICDFLIVFMHTEALSRKGLLKMKEYTPTGRKFFHFRLWGVVGVAKV